MQKRSILQNINLVLLGLVTFIMVWNRFTTNVAVGLWLGYSIFLFLKYIRPLRLPRIFWLAGILIIPYLIYWLVDVGNKQAIASFIRSLYFIIIPFCMYVFFQFNSFDKTHFIWKTLIFGLITSSLFLLLNAVQQTYIYGNVNPFHITNGNFFSYLKLTQILKVHPVYYGLYVCMAIAYLATQILKPQEKTIFNYILVGYLTILLLLLNSFILVACLGVLMLFILYRMYITRKVAISTSKSWVLMGIFAVSIVLGSNFIMNKSKGIHLQEDLLTTDFTGDEFTAVRARVAKAHASYRVFKSSPITGVGTAQAQEKLLKEYKSMGFDHGYKRAYNSHNQYLTFMIQFGVIGLIILVLFLLNLGKLAILDNNILLLFFVVITSMVFFTESLLERQDGVVFFSYFFSFLNFQHYNKRLK